MKHQIVAIALLALFVVFWQASDAQAGFGRYRRVVHYSPAPVVAVMPEISVSTPYVSAYVAPYTPTVRVYYTPPVVRRYTPAYYSPMRQDFYQRPLPVRHHWRARYRW